MNGARTAAPMKIAMHTSPTIAGRLRSSRANASLHSPRLTRVSTTGAGAGVRTRVAAALLTSSGSAG